MVTSANTQRHNMRDWIKRYRGIISSLVHILLFALAFFCAFGLYFNFRQFNLWFAPFYVPLLPLILVIKTIVFSRMKLFRSTWRYVGMQDLWSITMATHISTFFFVVCFFSIANLFPDFLQNRPRFPQSVFLLDWGATIGVVCGARLLVRLYYEEIRPVATTGLRRCLILGAGDTGEALLREILRMRVERYQVVGFLDDDRSKRNTRIHGVSVLGRISDAARFCEQHQIEELLLAMPSASQKDLRKIVERCQGMNVRFRTIPAMEAVIEGKVTVSQIRDVSIKDLLGREQVELDEARISEYIRNQRVLVTGAGGSIGSELCRQIARFRPEKLVLVEQTENNLFEIDRDLHRRFPDIPRVCHVADICDEKRMNHVLETESPIILFHAAAHKHVPMMEWNVGEAIKNNIQGTRIIADLSKKLGVQRFVMISTDKAVNPTSVMGCTKRVAEMYIQQLRQGSDTQFMTVRFGNVLGSSGSVVPIFAKQIASGGPVTVTDPAMTRYFMTIPEASQLVLQAGVMGHDGDIFVLDMGEPVKIVDLAREMITLSGLRPGEDIEVVFTGIRPGEKLYEELSVTGENMAPTAHEQIYVWRNKQEDWNRIRREADEIVAAADALTPDQLRRRLVKIVPEATLRSEPAPECLREAPAGNAKPFSPRKATEDRSSPSSEDISVSDRPVPYGESPAA